MSVQCPGPYDPPLPPAGGEEFTTKAGTRPSFLSAHDMDEALDLADIIIFMDKGRIVQMAPPEEMLDNPATEQVKAFLGKHLTNASSADMTASNFMRTGIVAVNQNRGINECISRMQHHNVDTLLVIDETSAIRHSLHCRHPTHRPRGQNHRSPGEEQHSHNQRE